MRDDAAMLLPSDLHFVVNRSSQWRIPTHRRRSQNSIHGGKADCRHEEVRPCAHLPAAQKRPQQNLLDVSWNSDTSDGDRPDLDWRCSHQSRREIDNLKVIAEELPSATLLSLAGKSHSRATHPPVANASDVLPFVGFAKKMSAPLLRVCA